MIAWLQGTWANVPLWTWLLFVLCCLGAALALHWAAAVAGGSALLGWFLRGRRDVPMLPDATAVVRAETERLAQETARESARLDTREREAGAELRALVRGCDLPPVQGAGVIGWCGSCQRSYVGQACPFYDTHVIVLNTRSAELMHRVADPRGRKPRRWRARFMAMGWPRWRVRTIAATSRWMDKGRPC